MLIRRKNPVDEAFIMWAMNFPESFHPIDMRRFYSFVKNKNKYKSGKWDDYSYFSTRIKRINKKIDEAIIKYYFDLMQSINDFLNEPLLSTIIDTGENKGHAQRNIINDEIITVITTEEEYLKGGISVAEVKRRHKATTNK